MEWREAGACNLLALDCEISLLFCNVALRQCCDLGGSNFAFPNVIANSETWGLLCLSALPYGVFCAAWSHSYAYEGKECIGSTETLLRSLASSYAPSSNA